MLSTFVGTPTVPTIPPPSYTPASSAPARTATPFSPTVSIPTAGRSADAAYAVVNSVIPGDASPAAPLNASLPATLPRKCFLTWSLYNRLEKTQG